MKYIWLTLFLIPISTCTLAQSIQSSTSTVPDRSKFNTHEKYSVAKENWSANTEASNLSSDAIELDAIILEGEKAETEFVHPTTEPTRVKGRTKDSKVVDPDIGMPSPE